PNPLARSVSDWRGMIPCAVSLQLHNRLVRVNPGREKWRGVEILMRYPPHQCRNELSELHARITAATSPAPRRHRYYRPPPVRVCRGCAVSHDRWWLSLAMPDFLSVTASEQ